MRAWIEMISPDAADGKLANLYEKARTPAGTVDNVMQAHSLRPHTMAGHVALYRAVLHHPDNTCLLYTSPSPRDGLLSRMPSSA